MPRTPDRPDTAEWASAGEHLVFARREVDWAIGDWALAGMADHGKRILDDAQRITRPEIDRLALIVETCRRFPKERRRATLRFAHHQLVAKLDDATANVLLDQAERENMTVAALRAALKIAINPTPVPRYDDDPADTAFRKLAQAWNRADKDTRQLLAEQLEESGLRVIEL